MRGDFVSFFDSVVGRDFPILSLVRIVNRTRPGIRIKNGIRNGVQIRSRVRNKKIS